MSPAGTPSVPATPPGGSLPSPLTLTLLAGGALTLWRLVSLHLAPNPLFFDEAQYHYWSLHPDWGYYSKPPVTAWVISLFSSVCGHGEACLRSASPVLHFGAALALYGAGVRLFKQEEAAAAGALLYLTAPAVALSSMLITTDAPLLFFLSLALFFFARAVERPRDLAAWIGCGVAGGFAMLSKYNAAWFAAGAVWYALAPERRYLLKTPGWWLAGLTGALVFAPNVVWNAAHGFVSFLHTKDNAAPGFMAGGITPFLEFFGAQFAVFGPLAFPLLLAALLLKRDRNGDSEQLLIKQTWPGLLCAGLVALLSRAHANWAAPAYAAGALLTARACVRRRLKPWLAAALALNLGISLAMPYGKDLIEYAGWKRAAATSFDKREIRDPFARLAEGPELGALTGAAYAFAPEGTFLLTDERSVFALLTYYGAVPHEKLRKWNPEGLVKDHFDMTASSLEDVRPEDTLWLLTRREQFDLDRYAKVHTLKKTFSAGPYPEKQKRYYLYELKELTLPLHGPAS